MRATRSILAAIFSTVLIGCSQSGGGLTSSALPQPPIDTTTPDRALKSYWAVKDWARSVTHARVKVFLSEKSSAEERQALGRITGGDLRNNLVAIPSGQLENFSREIGEVKVETDSRAVAYVMVKNTTEMPPGATLNKQREEWRAEGDRVKYVLEKTKDGWVVAEIFTWNKYSREWKLHYLSEPKENSGPWSPMAGI